MNIQIDHKDLDTLKVTLCTELRMWTRGRFGLPAEAAAYYRQEARAIIRLLRATREAKQ